MLNIKSNSKILEELLSLKTLAPSKLTNETFSALCKYVLQNDYEPVKDDFLFEINQICSNAEFELEKFWAKKIISSQNPQMEMENFTYYKNYLKLIKLEFNSIESIQEKIENVLFVGSWPLPLSAILLSLNHGVNCKLIDKSSSACELSHKLIKSLWLEEKIEIECVDIKNFKDNKHYDLCYIASLLCLDDQQKIFMSCENLNFDALILRTSNRTRQIMYKKVDEQIADKYFDKQLIVHPQNDIINSFIIYKK